MLNIGVMWISTADTVQIQPPPQKKKKNPTHTYTRHLYPLYLQLIALLAQYLISEKIAEMILNIICSWSILGEYVIDD